MLLSIFWDASQLVVREIWESQGLPCLYLSRYPTVWWEEVWWSTMQIRRIFYTQILKKKKTNSQSIIVLARGSSTSVPHFIRAIELNYTTGNTHLQIQGRPPWWWLIKFECLARHFSCSSMNDCLPQEIPSTTWMAIPEWGSLYPEQPTSTSLWNHTIAMSASSSCTLRVRVRSHQMFRSTVLT